MPAGAYGKWIKISINSQKRSLIMNITERLLRIHVEVNESCDLLM